ncbi:MAG: hypothetical protein IKR04_05000 [Clostridia bacterium]|nr:hypothetical protein [Clostridia bacterium]
MKKYTIVTISGGTIDIIAENFERDPQLGRLAFRIGDSNVAMFELSNIVGFYIVAQEGK